MRFWRRGALQLPKRRDERVMLLVALTVLLLLGALEGVRVIRGLKVLSSSLVFLLVVSIAIEIRLGTLVAFCVLVGAGCALVIDAPSAYWAAILAGLPVAAVDFLLRTRRARRAGMDGG